MDLSLNNYLFIGLLTTLVVTLSLWWYTYRSRLVLLDQQDQRSLHQGEAVTGGGVFIFMPVCLSGIILFPAFWPIYMVMVMCLLGLMDDKLDLSFQLRIMIQLVVAVITLYYFGFTSNGWMMAFLLLSLLWWVNLFNFMDGANGMAGLHGLVSLLFYFALLHGVDSVVFLSGTTVLLLMVYLVFNLGLNKLFMGDSGSLPLAWLIAVLALLGIQNGQLSLIQVATVHAVFITDATLTLFNRIKQKEQITQAHASHLYQRLIKNGAAHGRISGLYALGAVLCCLVAWLIRDAGLMVQGVVLMIIYLILLLIFMKTLNTGR